jgi:hypothetical protein
MFVAKLRVAVFCAALASVDARLTSESEGEVPRLIPELLPLLDQADGFQVQPGAARFRAAAAASQLPNAAPEFGRGGRLLMRSDDPEATRDGSYDEYMQSRSGSELEQIQDGYLSFKGIDQEFDGGDSGGGAVGDGNMDLEDQHNSPTLGALRGGIADFTEATRAVGRGNVLGGKVEGATESRTAAAGANYFGRSTGFADKLIDDMSDEDVKNHKMDRVRAQQKENWFNQRAIHANNRAMGQGMVFGAPDQIRPSSTTGYVAREALENQRPGDLSNEISQRDLANHLENLAAKPADRLDGEEWAEFQAADHEVQEVVELRTNAGGTVVHEISVKNLANVFAPFTCGFAPGSGPAFTVSPEAGTMNRASGDPIEVIVRYAPREMGISEATLVFQTEDFKKAWKFIGST